MNGGHLINLLDIESQAVYAGIINIDSLLGALCARQKLKTTGKWEGHNYIHKTW